MIEAVIWDFGGVLTSSPFEAFARYEAARGLPKDFIRGINATNPDTNAWAWRPLEAKTAARLHPASATTATRLALLR